MATISRYFKTPDTRLLRCRIAAVKPTLPRMVARRATSDLVTKPVNSEHYRMQLVAPTHPTEACHHPSSPNLVSTLLICLFLFPTREGVCGLGRKLALNLLVSSSFKTLTQIYTFKIYSHQNNNTFTKTKKYREIQLAKGCVYRV